MKTDQEVMDNFLETHKYDKTLRNWRDVSEEDEEELGKEWTASTNATSGITAYGNTKERRRKRRVQLLPKKEKHHGN